MVINVQCSACGTRLKVGYEAAGKAGKCPDCGSPVQVPDAVYDAENIAEQAATESGFPGVQSQAGGHEPIGAASGAPPARRRACPACGEQIVATAAKCRFCGEILDESIRSTRIAEGGSVDPKEIKKFRREMHGLGGLWIFIACLALLGALAMISNPGNNPELQTAAIVFFVIVMLFMGLGILICMKHMWAVYVGLVFAYLSALGNVYQLANGGGNIFSVLFLVAIIAQSHRSITASKKLRRAGIPLTTKA